MTCKACGHYNVCCYVSITSTTMEKDCKEFIPKSSIVKVRYGNWIPKRDPSGKQLYDDWMCSVCENYAMTNNRDHLGNYCSECGAYMKGKSNNEKDS